MSNKEPRQTPAAIKPAGSRGKWGWLIVLSLPAMVTGLLIQRYGVDIPYWDQWNGFCQLLDKRELGTLRFADFYALHNEHRILFPRLIMYVLATLTHWNVRAELLVVWLLGVTCALSVWRMARVTGWKQPGTGLWLLLGANVLLFSPLEHENWLWGFQIGFLLPTACTFACLWIAPAIRHPFNFIIAIGLCTICTFSGASGFTCWIITTPLLLLPEGRVVVQGRKVWLAVWTAGFAATTALYFRGYHRPEHHPGMAEAFTHWADTLNYFLAYLGGPFAHGTAVPATTVAPLAGFLLLVILATFLAYAWRWRRDTAFLAQSLPWFLMTLVALFNAGLTAIGRQAFGVSQALNSRYLAFSLALPLALLFLGALILRHWTHREPNHRTLPSWRIGVACLATVFFLLHALGSTSSVDAWNATKLQRLRTKALVLTLNVANEPQALARIHSEVEPLRARINILNRLGCLRPPLLQSSNMTTFAAASTLGAESCGNIDQAGKPAEGQYGLMGWAILPDKRRPADGVLLSYDDAQGQPILFALADMGMGRSDVAGAMKDPAYLASGWVKTFELGRLPQGAGPLRAWAFDAETARAYPISGSVTVAP
jgi:hypothetical protein